MDKRWIPRTLKKWAVCLAAVLLFLPFFGAAEAEEVFPRAFRQMGTPIKGTVSVYAGPSSKTEEIARLEENAQCEIIGAADASYYRVRVGDRAGYALKSKLSVETVQSSVPEALCDGLVLQTATPSRHEEYFVLEGSITAVEPLESLCIYVWDERQQRLEQTYMKELETPSARIDAGLLQRAMPLNKYSGGRKTLVLEGCTENETLVLYRSPAYVTGELQEPVHVTGKCRNLPDTVTDNKVSTAWVPKKSEPSLIVQIPETVCAALLTLEWKSLPDSFTVEVTDEKGELISKTEKQDVFYLESVPLTAQARTAVITPEGPDAALATLRIYGENYPALDVQSWKPLPEKIDILLVSTHQDDEFLFFGGSIPYYAAREDVTIGVLYMADCGRLRYREALNGLWSAGLRHYPIFLGLEDFYTLSIDKAESLWRKDDPGTLLVRAIRRYKPEVILSQDFNGEYGHGQHKYTAKLIADFFSLAADPAFDPESAAEWGVWQVKKCYVHLYAQNQIIMDWNVPLDDTGVITPMFLAWEGYDKNKSQLASFSMERDGVMYDNTRFGLYWSSVGPDIEKNDFMENVR